MSDQNDALRLNDAWSQLPPREFKNLIQECIAHRERALRLQENRETFPAARWYLQSNFDRYPLTTVAVGGGPTDHKGSALIVRARIGSLELAPQLAEWGRIPRMYLNNCPFCGGKQPETLGHLVFICQRWNEYRRIFFCSDERSCRAHVLPDLDGTRLSLLLGGSCDGRKVDAWIPLPPQEIASEDDEEADLTAFSEFDSDSSVSETHREISLDRSGPHCLQLGSILVRVMHERTINLRAPR